MRRRKKKNRGRAPVSIKRSAEPEQTQRRTDGSAPDIQRTANVEVVRQGEGDNEEVRVRVSVSSDAPVRTWRYLNGKYQEVYEILEHTPDAIDRTYIEHGLVIRDGHYGDQIGIISNPELKNGKLGGFVEFGASSRSKTIEADAKAGIRTNLSVEGNSEVTEEDGTMDDIPVVRVRKWAPLAAAFVAVPADVSVGVGRSAPQTELNRETPPEANPAKPETEPKTERGLSAPTITKGRKTMAEPTVQEAVEARIDEVLRMRAMARAHNFDPEETDAAIKEGMSEGNFARKILNSRSAQAAAAESPVPNAGVQPVGEKEIRKFSILKAIDSVITGEKGFEREVSDAYAKVIGKPAQGIYIPSAAIARAASVTGSGSSVVATELLTGSFIEALRAKSIAGALGVKTISGLVGDVAIPKQTGEGTGYWVSTDGDVTLSDQTLGQVKATPHTVGARTRIGRSMLKQPSIDFEAFVADDITSVIAKKLDQAIMAGTGGGGEPKGVIYADGINNPTVTTDAPTWAQLVSFISNIESDNAMLGSGQWAMTPLVWGELAATPKESGQAIYLASAETKTCAGFPYQVSSNVPSKTLIFGVWAQILLLMWGALDMIPDAATQSASGSVILNGLQDADVAVRHGESFSYNSAVIS